MSDFPLPETLESVAHTPDPWGRRFPFTLGLRFKLFVTGVALPAWNIGLGLSGGQASVGGLWQSGDTEVYASLFLQYPALLYFLPLLAYCMVAISAIVFRPRLRSQFWVRLGLCTGVILSIQYLIAVLVTSSFTTLVAGAVAAPLLALIVWLATLATRHYRRFTIRQIMIATLVVAAALTFGPMLGESFWSWVLSPVAVLFVAGPALCCLTYCRTAVTVGYDAYVTQPRTIVDDFRSRRFERVVKVVLPALSWLSAYFFAWRYAIESVMLEYQKLPTTQPDCYVASAAANGHPRFVKSRRVAGLGRHAVLNAQMQRLKFLEFAFRTAMPKAHRVMRAVYNRVGPVLASACQCSILFADVSFIALKPLEWLAVLVRVGLSIPSRSVDSIYSSEHE